MVIEEVSVLQTQLEIEKSCRENAEALATKLNCENRKLKYLSLSSRPCLDELLPSISDCIALEEEAEPQDPSPDPYTQYQQQVKVSMMATQEYGNLREQLDLELSLREKAESYAHEMLIKQKEANRQSMILLQQADPSMQLLKALEDVANVTKTLEQERLQRQRQVKDLEAQLQESALRRQLGEMQKHLELMEEEKRELEVRVQRAEERSSSMEHQGQSILTSFRLLVSLLRVVRSQTEPDSFPLVFLFEASVGADDVKVKAVNEMMERIKHGVVLRPVKGQATKETVKKSPSRGFPEVAPTKKDSELEVILRRRRKQNCDPSSGGKPPSPYSFYTHLTVYNPDSITSSLW
ncbi:UNVERIFIED_CONTAM: hypothetical protein FKN15_057533 [Acipenser sinensis]